MNTWLDDVIERVRDYDWSRPRSGQAAIGWSEAGGCRSHIGYRITGAFPEQTDTWAAQRGTAIHEYLLPILAGHQTVKIGGKPYLHASASIEVDTEYRGIPGHADLVDDSGVTDVKTTTLANSQAWAAKPALLRQKRIQAHGYAAGLVDEAELPPDCTVRILVVPVDGTFADWWVYEEPFDRDLADEGANRVEWVRAQLAAGEALPRDKPYQWCESYCGFFSLCRRPGDSTEDLPEITDEELAAAVDAYGEAHAVAGPAEAMKKALAPMIRGLRGQTPDGWKVTTSKQGEPGEEPDPEAIEEFFAEHGAKVPMREKPGQSPRLSVTRIKDKAKGGGQGE